MAIRNFRIGTRLGLGFALKAEGQAARAVALVDTQLVPALEACDASIKAMLSFQKNRIDQTVSAIDVRYRSSRMSLGAMALGGLLSWWLTLDITRPLSRALKAAQTVAAGGLTSRIVVSSKDETGQLVQALKNMNDKLVGIVGHVRGGTDSIATASSQIAAGNHDLSSRPPRARQAIAAPQRKPAAAGDGWERFSLPASH